MKPAGFFALRTPLPPHDELVSWSSGLRERLCETIKRPEVREALFVASPSGRYC
jgi:hypothetical protein